VNDIFVGILSGTFYFAKSRNQVLVVGGNGSLASRKQSGNLQITPSEV